MKRLLYWWGWSPSSRRASRQHEREVARLTAQADLILKELDIVVKQMSSRLREAEEKK